MLNVNGEKIEVPDPCAWNVVLMDASIYTRYGPEQLQSATP
jgi:hypothetical protein